MTLATLTAPASGTGHHLLQPALDTAAAASRDAHEAARALTDTVLACQILPAEVYQYAPDLAQPTAALTAATGALATAAARASADPTQERLYALHRATADLTAATTTVQTATSMLRNAASWIAQPTDLPAAQPR
ncbi:hypothetical protein GCM10009839_93460 [Catenulispora yoronensis]|uniref:Uncharacterized protein n=1 Tax=Catenulispora yoronensis TaxID=450799 RepID=A0ABP5H9X8_9ACTN